MEMVLIMRMMIMVMNKDDIFWLNDRYISGNDMSLWSWKKLIRTVVGLD